MQCDLNDLKTLVEAARDYFSGAEAVDDYDVPLHLYHTILYFEKKGMEAKCSWGRIPERYDCAIMASEGYAVRAAKSLLQAAQQGHRITMLCFHDADPAGYERPQQLVSGTKGEGPSQVVHVAAKTRFAVFGVLSQGVLLGCRQQRQSLHGVGGRPFGPVKAVQHGAA